MDLDRERHDSVYEELKSQLIREISLGLMKPDDRLPTVRQLARDLGVNPKHLHKVYEELEEAGIIYTISGEGSFVAIGQDELPGFAEPSWARFEQAVQALKDRGVADTDITERLAQILDMRRKQHDRSTQSDEAIR